MASSNYRILENIGAGTYGEVFKVERMSDERVVVMKRVNMNGMAVKEQEECLMEANVMSRLSHPNIVQYYESFIEGNYLHIIMEYADDTDLGHKILQNAKSRRHFDEHFIWNILICVCQGLDYIHGQRILHRDIKSQNIFMTKDQVAKIGDFGLGRILSTKSACASSVVGTPLYFSPEVCEEKKYDDRSDIWSFGVILYELCALRPPFLASNQLVLAKKIVNEEPDPIPDIYGSELRFLISRMLEKDPQKRPDTKKILGYSHIRPSGSRQRRSSLTAAHPCVWR